MMFNIREYDAAGIAVPKETLELKNLQFKWIRYQPGTKAVIYHPAPGKEYDSVGIQKAIDAANSAGGGTVIVPAGNYLIAPIEMKSRVQLHLEPGAKLFASPLLEDYSKRENLIYASGAEDFSITGSGEIHGQSQNWVIPWMNEKPESWSSLNGRRPGRMIVFSNCRRVLVDGVRIFNSPRWTLVFEECSHVQVHGIMMRHFDVINADGIDIVDTSNVKISDCDLHVTDDGICLKNIKTKGSGAVRNVAVSNCVIRTWCNGIKIGTETTGLVEDVTIDNIVVHNPSDDLKGAEGGINICSCDGGLVRNVNISNVVTRNAECAFYLVSMCRTKFQEAFRRPQPGKMERISISNVWADGTKYTSFVVGHPEQPIKDVYLSNINIRKTSEFRPGPFPAPVPASAQQYPNPFMFGSPEGGNQDCGDGLPAYGLYLRDVENITVRDFAVDCTERDGRKIICEENCIDLRM
ncbi:MAG: hypothetical protein A2X48_16990 [Lentisphaerae bacterium GWF2_49_21]|nr:MAG: hypothetical protein A2X48_16990 [Lentisphaerae bacterium GWF2_49_21]